MAEVCGKSEEGGANDRFFIKIEVMSIQSDHVHIIARISRRTLFQQIEREGLLTSQARVTDTPPAKGKCGLRRGKSCGDIGRLHGWLGAFGLTGFCKVTCG